jgi:hypothetical protein
MQPLATNSKEKLLKSLVIAEWSRVKNWAYVVLSHDKTLNGLFLTRLIPNDINFAPETVYLDMMNHLRQSILATPEQVSDLKQNQNWNNIIIS